MTKRCSFLLMPSPAITMAAVVWVATLFPPWVGCGDLSAADYKDQVPLSQEAEASTQPWHHAIDTEWGGHFKAVGAASWPDDQTCFQYVGTRTYYDGSLDFRLKNKLYFSTWGNFETHYEAILSGGDTRRKINQLQNEYPDIAPSGALNQASINDDHRLLSLTNIIEENDNYIFYQRLDRFVLTWQPDWGTAKFGRQAVTWGNGLLFNPMDLFNPFEPTDVIRDYKIGIDMANLAVPLSPGVDTQLLYVPRRDPVTGEVEWDESSLAWKMHFPSGTTEFDLMAAYHYQDRIVGIGSMGYWGNAAWRLDGTWTFLNSSSANDDYLSLVANIDYSWVWLEKNMYGLLEYFYNGLGETSYSQALTNPDISERIMRGELFTLGRHYLSGQFQLEMHPLLNTYISIITNLSDPSGIIQPRVLWDMNTDLQATLGANLHFGSLGTEYGGFPLPNTPCLYKPADSVYLLITYYF